MARRLQRSLLAGALVFLICGAANAPAAYLFPWDDGNPTVTDPDDAGILDSQDILAAWSGEDSNFYYFRLDVQGAPFTQPPPAEYAGIYGIYIDDRPGGADGPAWDYVPDELTAIDVILDSHFDPTLNPISGWWAHHHHVWNGVDFDFGILVQHQESENGGTTIEFQVSKNDIEPGFTWWAGTTDFGSANATYDLTQAVPEPTSLMLLALGAVAALRRR